MACFDNFIGVDGTCNDVVPTSGLNLSDIGLPITELNNIVTKDFVNGKAFGESKIDFALKLINNEVLAHFSNKIRPASLTEELRIGIPQENLNIELGVADFSKGIQLELCNTDDFLDVFVSSISLQLDVTDTVNVEVWDLIQNKLLDTIVVNAVEDEIITVFVNKTYKSDQKNLQLAFIYDSTGRGANRTFIKDSGCRSCGRRGLTRLNGFMEARGVQIDNSKEKTRSNFTSESETGGLSIVYSIQCNQEDWLCTFKNLLGLSTLYRAGFEIATHALHIAPNERINTSVTINNDIWAERLAFFEMKYKETFDNILKRIKLPTGRCYVCNISNKTVISLP